MANNRELSQVGSFIRVNDTNRKITIGSTITKIRTDELEVLGVSTLGVTSTTNLTAENLKVSGITTLGFLTGTGAVFSGIVTANSFISLGPTGLDDVTINNLRVTGVTTLGLTSATDLLSATLKVSGNIGIGTTNPVSALTIGSTTGITFIDSNIKIGNQFTGSSLIDGTDNIFFGKDAGRYNTSGINNTFIGSGSGFCNIDGCCNNFIGNGAGYKNTSGSRNTFIGESAGCANDTGNANTFIGWNAGEYNVTGSYNNFFGRRAGNNNTTGSCNSFFGNGSGYCNTTGSHNSFFGENIGISTASSYKVLIGSGDEFDSPDPTKDTQFAVGVKTDANPANYWLVGNENFNIGIGTTNPTSKLTVGGDARITGILTVGTVEISTSGNISTITSSNPGVSTVFYYGDGSNLINVTATTLAGISTSAIKLETPRDFSITGDIVSTIVSFDGTANVSLASTISDNVVGLGTKTYGDYVKNITGTTNEIEVSVTSGEGVSPQIGLPDDVTIANDLTIRRDLQIDRNLNVNGNITVGGTSAYLIVNNLQIKDKDIVLGITTDVNGNDISTDITANHGGIAIASTEGSPLVSLLKVGINSMPDTYKQIMWLKANSWTGLSTDAWMFNYGVGIGSTQIANGVRLAVGSGITMSDDSITAAYFYGNGSGLTNINSTSVIGVVASATTAINVIGGIGSITQLQVTGISTFTNGPVFVGSGTSTGTTSQTLQVTGGAYVSGNLGIGTTNPTSKLHVQGSAYVSSNVGVAVTSPSFAVDVSGDTRVQSTGKMRFGGTTGTTNFYIQYNSTTNSLDFVAG